MADSNRYQPVRHKFTSWYPMVSVGAWGIRTQRMNPPWLILYTLCLLGGLLLLARAFSFA